MAEILVQAQAAVLGYAAGEQAFVDPTDKLVDACLVGKTLVRVGTTDEVDEQPEAEVTTTEVDDLYARMKGAGLRNALAAVGLSNDGTLAERQARLRAHDTASHTDTPEDAADGDEGTGEDSTGTEGAEGTSEA